MLERSGDVKRLGLTFLWFWKYVFVLSLYREEEMPTKRKTRGSTRTVAPKDAVLTLRVNGPGIRKGRISVPNLIKLCQDAQSAVNRQAEALEGRKTLHPGPVADQIRHEGTLELIGLREGSTQLDFGLAKPQMNLPFEEVRNFGSQVVYELADTIKSLGNGNKKSDLDPGVLQSIYGLGSLVESGQFTDLKWVFPGSKAKQLVGSVSRKVREAVASQLSRPTFRLTQVDGVLDMADFSRRERKCRIDPAIGSPVICTFGPEHENDVHELIRKAVRVVGLGRIQPRSDRIDSLEIQKIQVLPSLHLGGGNFFSTPSIEQLADAQGVKPLKDASALRGVLASKFDRPVWPTSITSFGPPWILIVCLEAALRVQRRFPAVRKSR